MNTTEITDLNSSITLACAANLIAYVSLNLINTGTNATATMNDELLTVPIIEEMALANLQKRISLKGGK